MASLLNKSQVRKAALDFALVRFPSGKFTRVSQNFILGIEGEVKRVIESRVNALPSTGKTIN